MVERTVLRVLDDAAGEQAGVDRRIGRHACEHVHRVRRGVEGRAGGVAVVVLAGVQLVVGVGRQPVQRDAVGDVEFGVELVDVGLGLVDRVEGRLDVADARRLHLAGIGVAGLEAGQGAEQAAEGRLRVHGAERARVVQRGGRAALAEQALFDLADQAAGHRREGHAADVRRAGVLGAVLLADPRAVVVFLEVIPHHPAAEAVGGLERQGGARAVQLPGRRRHCR